MGIVFEKVTYKHDITKKHKYIKQIKKVIKKDNR